MRKFKFSNIKHVKTTLFGLVVVGLSIWYLVESQTHNNTLFFGMLIFGSAFIFLPDETPKFIKQLMRSFARRLARGFDDDSTSIDIDVSAKKDQPGEREIPNEK